MEKVCLERKENKKEIVINNLNEENRGKIYPFSLFST